MLGGGIGYLENMWLTLTMGTVGTGFFLAFTGLAFAVAIFNIAFKLPGRKIKSNPIQEQLSDIPPVAVFGNRIREEEENEDSIPEFDLPIANAYVHRDEIEHAAAALGVDLDEHIQIVLDAMKQNAAGLGLVGNPTP